MEEQIRSNEHIVTQITDILMRHEKMDEKLNKVSNFSNGDCDCSYEIINSFLDDQNFLILPSDRFCDRSRERKMSEQTEPDVISNDDTFSIHTGAENFSTNPEEPSRCDDKRPQILEYTPSYQDVKCDLFVIRDIKNSKSNKVRWLNQDPRTDPSEVHLGFSVKKKAGFERELVIFIRKKALYDEKPMQVLINITNHSKKPQLTMAQGTELSGDSIKSLRFSYSVITDRSKQNSFLDKNGNVEIQCIVQKNIIRNINQLNYPRTVKFIVFVLKHVFIFGIVLILIIGLLSRGY